MHALRPLEHRLLDSFVRSQAAQLAPDPDIVLVDIDEKSLARMEKDAGRWPWPRVVHAELIEGLAAQKPLAIVFDIAFAERDILGAARPLARSIAVCRDNLRRILDAQYARDIPLGVSVESVSIHRDEIDASAELFLALREALAGR